MRELWASTHYRVGMETAENRLSPPKSRNTWACRFQLRAISQLFLKLIDFKPSVFENNDFEPQVWNYWFQTTCLFSESTSNGSLGSNSSAWCNSSYCICQRSQHINEANGSFFLLYWAISLVSMQYKRSFDCRLNSNNAHEFETLSSDPFTIRAQVKLAIYSSSVIFLLCNSSIPHDIRVWHESYATCYSCGSHVKV